MAFWLKVTLAGLCAIAAGVAITLRIGRLRQDRTAERLTEQLTRQGSTTTTIDAVSFAASDQLPLPVAR
jgi:PIN domain nuclease of toxin-antitoxin system